jgi:hypothetical protein
MKLRAETPLGETKKGSDLKSPHRQEGNAIRASLHPNQ